MNKKLKWTLIGFGIFLLIVAVITVSFFLYFFIRTGIAVLHREFTPEKKVPVEVEENNLTDETKGFTAEADLIIDDLAYIKILETPYMDDKDPETDGIAIDIMFYNSKGEHISFENIPIKVNIKVYANKFNLDTGKDEIVEPPIYEGIVEIDHSMRFSEMLGNYIRIPFEDIGSFPDKKYHFGTMKVIVITPLQGNFEAKQEMVAITPY
ncbi:MAG: hypothetical protein M1475_00650 [Actinobacteria bacterium]|nr:hypothetical protein [Actinomycetota bacterium]